ncbi:MAG: type II toxin-antitoxin system VapC family toxin [Polyangiaceae bacterium]
MKRKVYLETTIVSYLTALPTRDLVRAAHQQITTEWWQGRDRFDLFVSEAVLQEAAAGDPDASARRLIALQGIRVLAATAEVANLAHRLVAGGAVPAKAAVDAVHIAVAATNGMDFLLTWNCTHIANAATRGRIEQACRAAGVAPPVICTPEELQQE